MPDREGREDQDFIDGIPLGVKIAILYATRTGNTEIIAKALAEDAECKAINVAKLMSKECQDFWFSHQVDLYVVGTGVYGGRCHGGIDRLVNACPFPDRTQFALFATWIGRGNSGREALDNLKSLFESKGGDVRHPYFLCFGKALFLRQGHPDKKDIEDAQAWLRALEGTSSVR